MKNTFLLSALIVSSISVFGQQEILNDSLLTTELNQKEREPKGLEFKNSLGDLRIKLDEKGDSYFKLGLNSQVWVREIDNNPGTLVNGVEQKNTYDAGLRRMRLTMQAQISPLYQIFLQFGIDNQSFISGGGTGTGANGQGKKPAIYFMDAYNEFAVIPQKSFKTNQPNNFNLFLGAGLHSVSGVSRLTNGSTSKILTTDFPLFNYPTVEMSDQLGRQLGIFARGEYNKFNYRFSVNKPFATNNQPKVGQIVDNNQSGKLSYSGYVAYQFMEKEGGATPVFTGYYLGSKRVMNFGVGFYATKDATLSQFTEGDFKFHDQSVLSADFFTDLPIGPKSKEMAITAYSVFYRYNFGPNYLRSIGIMNPGTINPDYKGTIAMEGAGNSKFLFGTGNIWFTEVGFVLPKFSDAVKLQPFVSYSLKDFEGLNQIGNYYDVGANLFILSQTAKISYQYSSRSLFKSTDEKVFDRKGEHILMFQLAL